MNIRRAEEKDIDTLLILLSEVLDLHAEIRPDIFIPGKTKYTREQLKEMLKDDAKPIFVAEDESGTVLGYAFCAIREQPFRTHKRSFKTLFIDDLCVARASRGMRVGSSLFEYVKAFAKGIGCYDVTLNVWEGNDGARAFYEKMGMFPKETQMEIIL